MTQSAAQAKFSVADIRKTFLDFYAAKGHTVVPVKLSGAGQRPDADVHQLGHGAVQRRVFGAGQAQLRARGHRCKPACVRVVSTTTWKTWATRRATTLSLK